MSPDPDAVREAMDTAERLDRQWLGREPGTGSQYLPWMPFPRSAYIEMIAEALPAAPGKAILDVGCGIGTRMLLAQEIFGLRATGIELSPVYAEQAKALGLHVLMGDAADFPDYGRYGLIWLYRPLRDPGLQAVLEKIVWDQMAGGAVLAGANLEAPPPDAHVIVDDWERKRGIWLKPPRA